MLWSCYSLWVGVWFSVSGFIGLLFVRAMSLVCLGCWCWVLGCSVYVLVDYVGFASIVACCALIWLPLLGGFGVCSCALLICVLVIKFVLVCLLGLLMLVCVPRF